MRRAGSWIVVLGLAGLLGSALGWAAASAATGGFAGDWMTPNGSVVRVARCDSGVCLTLVKLPADVKETHDARNPDAGLKTRALCGLRIGEGFVPDGDASASGGRLYDPESGKTYSGKMTMDGDRLKLRGYVGVSLFGRTEVWKKVGAVEVCRQG